MDPSSEQSFRFLDLPQELRFMIYKNLMDNQKNNLKFTQPKGLEIDHVYVDEMYYPSMLRVDKLVRHEYWSLCLRTSVLWIFYGCPELTDDEEDASEEEEDMIPRLSHWINVPSTVLAKVRNIAFQFQARWELPKTNPFSGVAYCVLDMPDLQRLDLYSIVPTSVLDFTRDQAEQDLLFQTFVDNMFDQDLILEDIQADEDRKFITHIGCTVHTPLYEMNKRFHWPRRRHLQQGVAPLAGLPEWGYSTFRIFPSCCESIENSFLYHGVVALFDRVEYSMPVFEREETEVDSPSEFDYAYDENGWATADSPDWG